MPARIRTDERVFICGKTGSGKTTLAKYLTAPIKRLVVFDSKGTLGGWGLLEYDDEAQKKLLEGEPARIRVLAPIGEDMDADEFWNEIFRLCFEAGNVTIYIDELFAIVEPGARAPSYMQACYTRGREFGIGVWASTQRPSWVPLFTMSEAEHYFMFRLTLAKDRTTMAAFMTEEVDRPIKDAHGFFYMAASEDAPKYFRQLDISGKPATTRATIPASPAATPVAAPSRKEVQPA